MFFAESILLTHIASNRGISMGLLAAAGVLVVWVVYGLFKKPSTPNPQELAEISAALLQAQVKALLKEQTSAQENQEDEPSPADDFLALLEGGVDAAGCGMFYSVEKVNDGYEHFVSIKPRTCSTKFARQALRLISGQMNAQLQAAAGGHAPELTLAVFESGMMAYSFTLQPEYHDKLKADLMKFSDMTP